LVGAKEALPVTRKNDYGISIILAVETNTANALPAMSKIPVSSPNLLQGCCVEVPCLVDKEGLHSLLCWKFAAPAGRLERTIINVQGTRRPGNCE